MDVATADARHNNSGKDFVFQGTISHLSKYVKAVLGQDSNLASRHSGRGLWKCESCDLPSLCQLSWDRRTDTLYGPEFDTEGFRFRLETVPVVAALKGAIHSRSPNSELPLSSDRERETLPGGHGRVWDQGPHTTR
jgi:hypothetical protein